MNEQRSFNWWRRLFVNPLHPFASDVVDPCDESALPVQQGELTIAEFRLRYERCGHADNVDEHEWALHFR